MLCAVILNFDLAFDSLLFAQPAAPVDIPTDALAKFLVQFQVFNGIFWQGGGRWPRANLQFVCNQRKRHRPLALMESIGYNHVGVHVAMCKAGVRGWRVALCRATQLLCGHNFQAGVLVHFSKRRHRPAVASATMCASTPIETQFFLHASCPCLKRPTLTPPCTQLLQRLQTKLRPLWLNPEKTTMQTPPYL